MKVLLFGASRGCGLEAAVQLVERGYACTVFLRDPNALDARLKAADPALVSVIKGDAFKADDVRAAFESIQGGPDIVVTSIGGRPAFGQNVFSPPLVPEKICERASQILLPALQKSTIEQRGGKAIRLIVVSSSGLGKVGHQELPMAMKPMYGWMLKHPHADKEQLELAVYHAAGLKHPDPSIEAHASAAISPAAEGANTATATLQEFIMVRPAFLTDGPRTEGKYKADPHLVSWTVSRADIGQFIAKECVDKDSKWLNQAVTVGY
ncbi:hypothetical protein HDU87_000735 [Geranomyces variabilis]|uniref:NAD(P)-binding domain-containing protein n=1 Tax=Geranomyces variabilis TaxID=109894 RepID=A0AAD5XPL6_9FUNG|nr:hypothetical protein HDU87_000735 [Geranomyces variabilis]